LLGEFPHRFISKAAHRRDTVSRDAMPLRLALIAPHVRARRKSGHFACLFVFIQRNHMFGLDRNETRKDVSTQTIITTKTDKKLTHGSR
jgi:hypothetical protein